MVEQMSLHLKKDEIMRMNSLMESLNLNRHQLVKLALRRFLFPTEVSSIPLDGAYAEITKIKHLDDVHRRITITKGDEKKSTLMRVE